MDQDTIQKTLENLIPWITKYGLQVIGAIIILILGRIVAGIVGNLVNRAMTKADVDPSLASFTSGLSRFAVMGFAVIAALAKFGIETTSFIAVLGAAGFAIGLALQGSLANFAAGVMLLLFKPFKIGDLVELAGHLGYVEDIGIFVTVINTLDHQKIIIPNGKITSDVINNVNGNGIRRVDLTAGISYSDDMEKAKKLVMEVMQNDPQVLSDPAPECHVSEMADSSVNFVVRPWCTGDDYWDVYFGITQKVKEAFDANGVSIPFPQRDVHLFQK